MTSLPAIARTLLPALALCGVACSSDISSDTPAERADAGSGGGGVGGDLADAGSGGSAPIPQIVCDDNLTGTSAEADLAKAMELCDESLLSIQISSAQSIQHGITTAYGQTYKPKTGMQMAVISTGGITSGEDKDEGDLGGSASHPAPGPDPANGCGVADPSQIQDLVKIELRLKAPAGAQGFQYDFNFMSAEFPEFHCTEFDDTFLAILQSSGLNGNISFDENDNVISINTGFFDVCNPGHAATCMGDQELSGTGFEGRGGTGWLTTIAPITGGEEFSLTFYLFDEGDAVLTSQVLIDNFKWIGEDVDDDPITID